MTPLSLLSGDPDRLAPSVEVALGIYRTMLLNRRLDERMMILQRQGRVGFYGTCTGQEAVPAAVAAALAPNDWVFPGLREGAVMLHRGYPLVRYVAQVFGNAMDPTLGRQMPSHQADASVRQVSWSSCIGSQVPHAVGMARAARDRATGAIAVAFFGDGACSTRDVASSLRMAHRWKAPCVFVCQNNHWAISIPSTGQSRVAAIVDRAAALGIPRARVDGNDALAVFAAVRSAADEARAGGGPVFLECETYRLGAHSSADDPTRYRDPGEVARWRARDPLDRLRLWLEAQGVDPERLGRLDRETGEAIRSAVDRAEQAPPVEASCLETDVLATQLSEPAP